MGRPKKEEAKASAKKIEEKIKAKPVKAEKAAKEEVKVEKAAKVEAKAPKAAKEEKVKEIKKATVKEEKDAGKKDKKKAGPEFTITVGVPEASYRPLPDPTWNALFSTIFGTPGFVKGKCYEFAGESDVGKSALASTIAAMFQRAGEKVFYVDAERSMNSEFSKKLGYDVKKLLYVKPDNGEAAFQGLRKVVSEMGGTFGILDSSGACTPKSMVDDAGNAMGALARLTSQEMPKVDKVIDNYDANLIIISQVKIKPGVTFGNPKYVTGGSAVGFHTRFRCQLSSADTIKDDASKQVLGYTVRLRVTKNHTGPKRTTPFDLRVDNLFRPKMTETAAVWAKQFGLIDKKNNLVAGKFEFSGAGSEKEIIKAITGHEQEIFEACDEVFKKIEAGSEVAYEESDDESQDVDSDDELADADAELTEISVSDDELEAAGTI